MRKNSLRLIATSSFLLFVACHYYDKPVTGDWTSDDEFFDTLVDHDLESNGIEVGEPEIYDDSSLRIMLETAQARLAAINGLGETALTGHLGAVTGGRIDVSQTGLQVTGSSLPGTVTEAKGATTQTSTSAQGDVSTIANAPIQNVTTTASPMAPPTPPSAPSGPAFTPPTGMSGSALDFLNEQMQLTYEIAGLRLMLEGSVSARFVKNERFIKPRATIGFPISLKPQPRYRNAVAVVEVEVETAHPSAADPVQGDPPIITALLPQEKSYNVAALTDRTTSIGAGAVIGAVGVAGNFLRARRTFYLVQDQDTIAIQRPRTPRETAKCKNKFGITVKCRPDKTKKDEPKDTSFKNTASFAWEFRPVLGREYVRGGMKRTFVQLAFPRIDIPNDDCFGTIKVRTYWRYFNQKGGISEEVIKGSVFHRELFPVAQYDLTPFIEQLSFQDLGDGTVRVFVNAKYGFMADTYVQVGPTRYDTSSGLRMDETGLSFIAPATALARWTGHVISRDGKKAALVNESIREHLPTLNQFSCLPRKDGPSPDTNKKVEIHDIRVSPDRQTVDIEMQTETGPEKPIQTSLIDKGSKTTLNLSSATITGLNTDQPILRAAMASDPAVVCDSGQIEIKTVILTPLNESTTQVSVKLDFDRLDKTEFSNEILLDIGHKIYGLGDTVVRRNFKKKTITAVVPTSALIAGQRLRVFRLFWTSPEGSLEKDDPNTCFNKFAPLGVGLDSAVERLVLVTSDKEKTTYLLYGNNLKESVVLLPKEGDKKDKDIELTAVGDLPEDRVRLLTIKTDKLPAIKKLVIQKKSTGRPLVLDLPQPESKPAQPPKITLDSPVIQNTDELDVAVERGGDLRSVKLGKKELTYTPGEASIRLTNLRSAGVTSEQKTQELTFEYTDTTKVTVKLDVVAARVGVKQ
ncbi:MAG TPA: hypothetical protein VLB76_26800 [Thermoanaerobaculia bacterium]|jgi:hypothetical protein|nr:hypothetical protein [Thermoanaerobaculia bacterium]